MTIVTTKILHKILKITRKKCKKDLLDHNQKKKVVKSLRLPQLDLYLISFKIKEFSNGQELVLENKKPIDYRSLLKSLPEMYKLHNLDFLVKLLELRATITSLKRAQKAEMKKQKVKKRIQSLKQRDQALTNSHILLQKTLCLLGRNFQIFHLNKSEPPEILKYYSREIWIVKFILIHSLMVKKSTTCVPRSLVLSIQQPYYQKV